MSESQATKTLGVERRQDGGEIHRYCAHAHYHAVIQAASQPNLLLHFSPLRSSPLEHHFLNSLKSTTQLKGTRATKPPSSDGLNGNLIGDRPRPQSQLMSKQQQRQ